MLLLTVMEMFPAQSFLFAQRARERGVSRACGKLGAQLHQDFPVRERKDEFRQQDRTRDVTPLHPRRRKRMTTSSGHTTAILASKVKGTAVYNNSGDKIGTVEDVVLDKQSNQIMFAALGFGGVLGMGEKYYPVPWSMLNYDEDKGGYVVPLSKDRLDNAPAYDLKDLTKHDGSLGAIREQSYSYYNISRDWH
jgi:sporulation protein YlmC with PRC-barrel domain